MNEMMWVLLATQVVIFLQIRRVRKTMKLNLELVRITPMLLEIVALQADLQKVQNDINKVQDIESEFKRIIGNL